MLLEHAHASLCDREFEVSETLRTQNLTPHLSSEFAVGQKISDWQLTEFIGKGGSAEVWKATEVSTPTPSQKVSKEHSVILKVALNEKGAEMLSREEDIYQKIKSHSGTSRLLESHLSDPSPHLVLKYIPGKTLREIMQENSATRLSEERSLQITLSILNELKTLHKIGVLHLDVKPENIVIDSNNNAHLIDFGISKSKDGHTELEVSRTLYTQEEALQLTPRYAAPEQKSKERLHEISSATDLYAVALIYQEMSDGKVGSSPSARNRFLEIAQVMAKTKEDRPDQRYASASAMQVALMAAKSGSQIPESRAPLTASTSQDPHPALDGSWVKQFKTAVGSLIVLGGLWWGGNEVRHAIYPMNRAIPKLLEDIRDTHNDKVHDQAIVEFLVLHEKDLSTEQWNSLYVLLKTNPFRQKSLFHTQRFSNEELIVRASQVPDSNATLIALAKNRGNLLSTPEWQTIVTLLGEHRFEIDPVLFETLSQSTDFARFTSLVPLIGENSLRDQALLDGAKKWGDTFDHSSWMWLYGQSSPEAQPLINDRIAQSLKVTEIESALSNLNLLSHLRQTDYSQEFIDRKLVSMAVTLADQLQLRRFIASIEKINSPQIAERLQEIQQKEIQKIEERDRLFAAQRRAPMRGLDGGCFVAGTQVSTPQGLRNIESIQVGDEVYAYDEKTQAVVVRPVLETYQKHISELIHLTLADGTTFQVTFDHEFFDVESGQYIPAKNLRAKHTLFKRNANGILVRVQVKSSAVIQMDVPVYNFNVKEHHNYFSNEVLVHNLSS